MHQSVLRFEDTLAGANLTHLEEGLDGFVGTSELQVVIGNLRHKHLTPLQFFITFHNGALLVRQRKGLDIAIEGGTFSCFQRFLEIFYEVCVGFQYVFSSRAVLLVGGANLIKSGHEDGLFLLTNVLNGIYLADRSTGGAGEELARQLKLVAVTLNGAMDIQNAVYGNRLYFLLSHITVVGRHSLQEIHIAAGHPAGVRVIRNGSEHRKHQMAVHLELLLFVHTPVINHRGTMARHLYMVGIGQFTLRRFPLNGMRSVDTPSVFLCLNSQSTEKRNKKEKMFHFIFTQLHLITPET